MDIMLDLETLVDAIYQANVTATVITRITKGQ
jgi:hypothetical protein